MDGTGLIDDVTERLLQAVFSVRSAPAASRRSPRSTPATLSPEHLPMLNRRQVELKTVPQMQTMHRAGLVLHRALDAAVAAAVPGTTTADLDAVFAGVHPGGRRRRRTSWGTTATRPPSAPR